MPEKIINRGVILGRRPSDFVAGTLPYEVRLQDGNWKQFLPLGEWQNGVNFDSMACVAFSLLNCIETQEFMLTGKRINYSDRWTAKMSNTQPNGNYLYLVADTVRKYGLVKEESWPCPVNPNWNSYYADPDPATQKKLLAEGQEWLRTHQLAYEWLTTSLDDILKHLKHCPLQVIIPGHAIESFFEEAEVVNYFDSYGGGSGTDPFEKKTQRSNLQDVFKPLLTIINMSNAIFIHKKGTPEYAFILPAMSVDAVKDKALNLGREDLIKADGSVDFAQAKEVDY